MHLLKNIDEAHLKVLRAMFMKYSVLMYIITPYSDYFIIIIIYYCYWSTACSIYEALRFHIIVHIFLGRRECFFLFLFYIYLALRAE